MNRQALRPTVFMLSVCVFAATPLICEAGYVVETGDNSNYSIAMNLDPYFTNGINSLAELGPAGPLADVSASVYGFSGDSTYDYYRFSVGTGSSPLMTNTLVAFDTDFAEVNGSLDTVLVLFGTDGTSVLAYNDDAPFDGPGDLRDLTFNSFLSHTFTTAGTYYIRVGQYQQYGSIYGNALSTVGGAYQLHISSMQPEPEPQPVPVPSSLLLMISGLLAYIGIKPRFAIRS